MAKITILIALLLLLCTMIHGFPCSDYYTYTVKPETNDEIIGQIEIPSQPENSEYSLKVGFNINLSVHKV